MLTLLSNTARDYAWGSTTLLPELQGRTPSGAPEAELWFGDHPGAPAFAADGAPLGAWLAARGAQPLPYLLKLLAAGSPLSIQAHPSKAQAEAGFAREEDAGMPRDGAHRTYRDANHKPELIVALSAEFHALAGLRPLPETRRLLALIGDATAGLSSRLDGSPEATSAAIAWLLSDAATGDVRAVIGAARAAGAAQADGEFTAELALAARLDDRYPGDPGIVVALLMNLVTLRRGEGLFVAAGVLHAYLEGLGVEIMATSDNVLRGGLTPKHIDAAELVAVLDARTGPPPVVRPVAEGPGVERYAAPVPDFALRVARPDGAPLEVGIDGVAIVLATSGSVTVAGGASGEAVTLSPGEAVLVTADERTVRVAGSGEVFLATPAS